VENMRGEEARETCRKPGVVSRRPGACGRQARGRDKVQSRIHWLDASQVGLYAILPAGVSSNRRIFPTITK
jgi:hypothetical protein